MGSRDSRAYGTFAGRLRDNPSRIGFAPKWTETGGYVRGHLGPSEQLVDYLNQFAPLGAEELLIAPLNVEGAMEEFLDRFDREVRPRLK
jgi:hypothetical protein